MLQSLAVQYLEKKEKNPQYADEWFILNDIERTTIAKVKRRLILLSGLTGAMGVVLYYAPVHLFPAYFQNTSLTICGEAWSIPIISNVYSLILGIAEVALLTFLNLDAVHKIADVCGYPDKDDPWHEQYLASLAEASLAKKDKRVLHLGLNPLQGIPKVFIFLLTVFNFIKAALSNFLIRVITKRMLGRFLLAKILDYVSVPVYALWNMYSANLVMKEAKIRIMAPKLIEQMCELLYQKFHKNPVFAENLHEVLQAMTATSRRFHYTHYVFASRMLHQFQLPADHEAKAIHLETLLPMQPDAIQKAYLYILVFGFIIDGNFGEAEKMLLRKLNKKGVINLAPEIVNAWQIAYIEGHGMKRLMEEVEAIGRK
jgi:hypothetical protein